MKFGAPEFIKWLLLILPLIVLFIVMHRRRAARLTGLISSNVWKTVMPGLNTKRIRRRTILRLLALFCILLALTRPQWGSHWEEVQHRGLDIIVVLDTSKSMLAEDIKPNRLQQAKWAVRDFVKHLKGDRIGLVAFAGSSFLQCPVTVDYAAFTMMLDDLYAGIIPRGGTAIGQALKTAEESFDDESKADRVIILITDGEDHESDTMKIAEELKKNGIKLFSIGVGTPEGELVPTQEGYVKDSQGHVVKSSLNETLLEKLARETGGFYVRSAPGDFGLDRIYKLGIAGLQRDEQETRLARIYEERFIWFAAAALFFLLAEGLLRPRKTLIALAVLFFLQTPRADAAEWEKAYRGGDYSNAFQTLEKTVKKFPDIGNYDRGNALYRMNDFQGSEKAYADAAALTENDKLKEKAIYNRGTALFRSAHDAQQDPKKTEEAIGLADRSIKSFEEALSLDPSDTAAKKNLERILKLKKQLEEKKKQQDQQKQQQNKDQQKNKDQKDQNKDQQKNQDQKKQDQNQQQNKNQQDQQKQDQQKKDQQKKDQEQKQNEQQNQQQSQQDQQKQNQQNQDQQQQQSAQPREMGEMSKEEAQQLLDAMKQNEQDQRSDLRPYLGQPVRVDKDW